MKGSGQAFQAVGSIVASFAALLAWGHPAVNELGVAGSWVIRNVVERTAADCMAVGSIAVECAAVEYIAAAEGIAGEYIAVD